MWDQPNAPFPHLMNETMPVEKASVDELILKQLKRSYDLFAGNAKDVAPPIDENSQKLKLAIKIRDEYAASQHLVAPAASRQAPAAGPKPSSHALSSAAASQPSPSTGPDPPPSLVSKLIDDSMQEASQRPSSSSATTGPSSSLVVYQAKEEAKQQQRAIMDVIKETGNSSAAVSRRLGSRWPRPIWRAPWKMYRVIAGHLGWVRSLAIDPTNEWFCTGSADRTIKIWDLASGQLKLTLTGHIEQVTGLAVSPRHPYMFSCGLDKMVKCWDLESNKVIRSYHGHLSGVYSLAIHPTLDLLMTGGRDSVCRVWDMVSPRSRI